MKGGYSALGVPSLLNRATNLALASGICTSLLLLAGFARSFLDMRHIFCVGALFVVAVALLVRRSLHSVWK